MESYEAFSLPLSGLDDGDHHFTFEVEEDFFKGFDQSPISSGEIQIDVELDKRPDMLVFWFDIAGNVEEQCDRCLASISLPISGRYRLIGKYGEGEEDADVFYLSAEAISLNIAKFIYDYCCLSVPLSKTYDCEEDDPQPCDKAVLAEQEKDTPENNPLRDQLKNLNLDF